MTFHLVSRSITALVLALGLSVAAVTDLAAQTPPTVRVGRRVAIMDTPRPDGFVLVVVNAGDVLELLGQRGDWLEIRTPSGTSRPRGWIQRRAVERSPAMTPAAARPKTPITIRVFGQAGGTWFTARSSFDAIFGTSAAPVFGGGAMVTVGARAFVQASAERITLTGHRVLVSGTQAFTLPGSDVATLTPIQVTAGFRDRPYGSWIPYVGLGLGWLRFSETSDADDSGIARGHVSYHVLGGAERPLGAKLSVAGEAQWTGAPHILGDTGISAAAQDDDLGGATIRFKLIVAF